MGNITGQDMKTIMLCHTMHLYSFYGVFSWTFNTSFPPIGHIIFSNTPWNVNHMEQLIWTKKSEQLRLKDVLDTQIQFISSFIINKPVYKYLWLKKVKLYNTLIQNLLKHAQNWSQSQEFWGFIPLMYTVISLHNLKTWLSFNTLQNLNMTKCNIHLYSTTIIKIT